MLEHVRYTHTCAQETSAMRDTAQQAQQPAFWCAKPVSCHMHSKQGRLLLDVPTIHPNSPPKRRLGPKLVVSSPSARCDMPGWTPTSHIPNWGVLVLTSPQNIKGKPLGHDACHTNTYNSASCHARLRHVTCNAMLPMHASLAVAKRRSRINRPLSLSTYNGNRVTENLTIIFVLLLAISNAIGRSN